MRSTQLFTLLALLATSVSSASIGHSPDQLVHRRHAAAEVHNSVLQARGARRYNPAPTGLSERAETAPRWSRKRGINQRRCAAKTTTSSPAPASTTPAAATSAPEPEPTTSSAEPTTTKAKSKTTETPTKTSTSTKASATSDDSSSSSGGSHTGQGTFYAPGLGACGIVSADTDMICAVSQLLYDGFEGYTGGDPNSNPICGRKIKANFEGKSVTVTIVDRCVGCAIDDIDFSPSAFSKIADQARGRISGLKWDFV